MNLWRPIYIMLVASLGVHVWASHSFDPGIESGNDYETEDENIIELTPIPKEDFKHLDTRGKQVVELPPGPDTEPPDEYDYIAERNSRVTFQTSGSPDRSSARVQAPPSIIMEIEEKENDSGAVTVVNTKALFPSYSDLKEWLEDEPGNIDHLEGVLRGEITQVNARSYKYAIFFNQFKRTLYFYWNPAPALLLSGGPTRDVETRLYVVVEGNGVLRSIDIIHSSGYPRVDKAAVDAFRRATPIYNIPEGLLNSDGDLEMTWSFIIVY